MVADYGIAVAPPPHLVLLQKSTLVLRVVVVKALAVPEKNEFTQ